MTGRPLSKEQLLAGLNQAQADAVTTSGAPVAVMAGAGSGKTRVLTRRIVWRIVDDQTDPSRVLALTFTRKAANELRHRLQGLGLRDQVTAGTFHATALLQLRQRWAERGVVPPALIEHRARFVAKLLTRSNRANPIDVMAEIDWARARLVGPEHYEAMAPEAGRTPALPATAIAEIMVRYQQEKQRKRVVDFDDLLMLAIRDLRADGAYAEAVRWRYRHLYVDEFQDVNPLQNELLNEWRGQGDDLFVVGDPNQAIYGWNGADPNLLARFVRREPGATVIDLKANYRSTPQVLALAAAISPAGALEAQRPDGPVPTITAYADDKAEAAGIANGIRQARTVAGSWSDQAVLVRTNAQLLLIEQTLHEAGIPTRLKGGSGPLATPEVRAQLKRLVAPEAEIGAALIELQDQLADDVEGLTIAEIERRANLAALARLVADYLAADPAPNGPGLEAWISTLQAGDVSADDDAVELATFHGAKGLEWPVVHIAGLEEGFVPIAYASTGGQRAEEKRLLYVAITRAESELHLSWAAERTFTNRPVKRQASPHLAAVADAIARLGVGPAQRVDWRVKLAESRRQLDQATAPDPAATPDPGSRPDSGPHPTSGSRPDTGSRPTPAPAGGHDGDTATQAAVYEALHAWRQRRARASDVPPHAVFNDQTLRAIAADRPTSKARLAAMPGMRPTKLNRYAEDLLRILAEQGVDAGR